jgi:hypothetical protein
VDDVDEGDNTGVNDDDDASDVLSFTVLLVSVGEGEGEGVIMSTISMSSIDWSTM